MEELSNAPLKLKELRRFTPEIPPSSRPELNLCDPRELLSPEAYQERSKALGRLASARTAPPDDIIVA